jgi:hypothetical protein
LGKHPLPLARQNDGGNVTRRVGGDVAIGAHTPLLPVGGARELIAHCVGRDGGEARDVSPPALARLNLVDDRPLQFFGMHEDGHLGLDEYGFGLGGDVGKSPGLDRDRPARVVVVIVRARCILEPFGLPLPEFLYELLPLQTQRLCQQRAGALAAQRAALRRSVLIEFRHRLRLAVSALNEERLQQLASRVLVGRAVIPLRSEILDSNRMDDEVLLALPAQCA